MKKVSFLALMIVLNLWVVGQVTAGPSEHLNWGSQINASQCGTPSNNLVINVTQQVTGDIDSGCAGNYWAYDEFNKHMQVWQVSAVQIN